MRRRIRKWFKRLLLFALACLVLAPLTFGALYL